MRIDCSLCAMQDTHHCDDCLVSTLVRAPQEAVEIDEELDLPLQALTGAGLVPVLRFRPRAEDDDGSAGYQADTG